MTAAVLAVVVAVVASLFAKEAAGLAQQVSRKLVGRAIEGLPEDVSGEERDRWVSEILADLESYSERPFGALLFALNVRRRGVSQLAGVLAPAETRALAGEEEGEAELDDVDAVIPPPAALASNEAPPPHDPRWYVQIRRVDELVQRAHETLSDADAARIEEAARRLRIQLTTLRIRNSTGTPGNIDRATPEFSRKARVVLTEWRKMIEAGQLPPSP